MTVLDKSSASVPPSIAAGAVPGAPLSAAAESPVQRAMTRILGKRRRYILDRQSQLRAGLLASAVVLVLLVLLNLTLYAIRSQETHKLAAGVPGLERVLRSQDRAETLLIALASVLFLGGVFLVTVLETHKTSGAAYNLDRRLAEVAAGRYNVRLRLRRGDRLRGLEEAFNDMCQALQDRAWDEAEVLDRLAAETERLGGTSEATGLVHKLRLLADEKRRMAD